MHLQQRQQTHDLLRAREISRALFSNIASVKWLTGFAPPIQLGTTVFSGGPPLVWYEDGQWTLIILDAQVPDAAGFDREPNCSIVSYEGYSIEHPLRPHEALASALRSVVPPDQTRTGKLGIEENDLPVFLWEVLRTGWHAGVERVSIDRWLAPFRMIKTEEEIKKLRENFDLTEVGQSAARRAVQVGLREIDIWNVAHNAIEKKAGRRIPLGNDCVVGHREANIGGWPLDLEIVRGDSVIVDLSTVLHGYWSDSCATYYAGPISPKQRAMHAAASNALDLAKSLVRPGAVAREVDARVRKVIADSGFPVYPHHTGHSVGVTSHESPRLVPYSEEVLQAGMVIMLEPGIYFPGETSIRLEDAVLITNDGIEVLTHHDQSIPN